MTEKYRRHRTRPFNGVIHDVPQSENRELGSMPIHHDIATLSPASCSFDASASGHAGSDGWVREFVWVAPLPPTQLPDSTSEIPDTSSESEELPLIDLVDVVTPVFNFDTGTTLNF
jgi:hypothetical protein